MIFVFTLSEDGDYYIHSYKDQAEFMKMLDRDYLNDGTEPPRMMSIAEFNSCRGGGWLIVEGKQT